MGRKQVVATISTVNDETIEFTDVKIGKIYINKGMCSSKRFANIAQGDLVKFTARTYEQIDTITVKLSSIRNITRIKE